LVSERRKLPKQPDRLEEGAQQASE
jgi:hypothetical protein